MADVDFESILSKNVDDVERPKPLPEGHYTARITDYSQETSAQKGTPGIQFTFTIEEPGDDVEEDELEEFGSVVGKTQKHTFWVTENSEFRLKEFLQDHVGLSGDTFGEMLQNCQGELVTIEISHRQVEDNIFSQVRSTAAAA